MESAKNPAENKDELIAFVVLRGATLQLRGEGQVAVSVQGQEFHYSVHPSVEPALHLLSRSAATQRALIEAVPPEHRHDASALIIGTLAELSRLSAVGRAVVSEGRVIALMAPESLSYRLPTDLAEPDSRPLALSRFAYLRRTASALVVESPLAWGSFTLFDAAYGALVTRLACPVAAHELVATHPHLCAAAVIATLDIMLAEGFIGHVDTDGSIEMEETTALRQWEFHDLLFHTRTRIGRHTERLGGTYRFRGVLPPLPAVKPPMGLYRIPLPQPDLTTLATADVTLTRAIEGRASVRVFGPTPISFVDLAAFLFRTARVRKLVNFDGVDLTSRPYPSGGASYELEIYPLVNRCIGLLPGLYHYAPLVHALEPVTPANPLSAQLLADARSATGNLSYTDVLLIVSSRFQRVSWKYEGIAYAVMLKNLGALYQTMYLIATSMGLGACAVGCGNSEIFSKLIGEDYYTEASIGEFMLGSRHWN
jgi:SagB-type dehydrogenase family enzyme